MADEVPLTAGYAMWAANNDAEISEPHDGENAFWEYMGQAFMRSEFIASHDAEVARAAEVKALREAARDLYGDERAAGPFAGALSVGSWLRDRADRKEQGDG